MMKLFILFFLIINIFAQAGEPEIRKRLFVDITNPQIKKLPIAILSPKNISDSSDTIVEKELKSTLEFDLDVCGMFRLINEKAFMTRQIEVDKFNPEDWAILGANGVVATHYKISGSNLITEFRYYEVSSGKMIIGKRYSGGKSDTRIMSHKFANEVSEYYTGEPGAFLTKIAFVSTKTGNKEIYVMDYDGQNLKQITFNKSINLSPKWAPDNKSLIYISLKDRAPAIWLVNFETMIHRKLIEQKGTIAGLSWHPDGKRIVYSATQTSEDGDSDLYMLDVTTQKQIRLTASRGQDTSPMFSKDGNKIVFVSERVGRPQIYTMNIDGSNIFRITFAGRYNADPAYSPKNDKIAFAGWDSTNFDLFMINPDATNMERLTKYTQDNEHPSWSPDGRIIVFHSTRKSTGRNKQSNLYFINANGLGEKPLLENFGSSTSPEWSYY